MESIEFNHNLITKNTFFKRNNYLGILAIVIGIIATTRIIKSLPITLTILFIIISICIVSYKNQKKYIKIARFSIQRIVINNNEIRLVFYYTLKNDYINIKENLIINIDETSIKFFDSQSNKFIGEAHKEFIIKNEHWNYLLEKLSHS